MRPNTPTALLSASACAWAYVWVVSRTSEGYGGLECDPGACRFSAMATVKKIWRKLADGAHLRHIRIHDLRGTYTSLAVSAGVPIYFVSKSLGHSDTATTEKHYASLAPGAARETPNILERFVRNATVQNANQVRTE